MFNAMRGLRVLDLRWTRISALLVCVGKMILLKVLNLRGTMIKGLPKCVRNLKELLFLAMPEIKGCDECLRLPKWIQELERLQHLEVPNVSFGHRVISKMVSLRTLRSFFINLPIVEELSKVTHLREVRLDVENDMELEIVAQLVNLHHLRLYDNKVEQELLQFLETMRGMKHLEKLMLQCFAVPSWISDLVSIRELFLDGCEYIDFPELERMPDLVKLELACNEGCKELPKAFGVSRGFPCLRFLDIVNFTTLKELPQLEERAMPYLEDFLFSQFQESYQSGKGTGAVEKTADFLLSCSRGLVAGTC